MKVKFLFALAISVFVACLGDPIPQGLHQDSVIVTEANLLGDWVRYNDMGEEEYRIVFNKRGSFDIYYFRHRRALVWGMYEKTNSRMSLRYSGGDVPLGCGESGDYTFGNVEDELLVTLVSDPCAKRREFIQGVWQLSAPKGK